MFVLASLDEQFLGGGAGGGGDAEEVGAAGPGGDVEVGLEARGGKGVALAALLVKDLYLRQVEVGGDMHLLRCRVRIDFDCPSGFFHFTDAFRRLGCYQKRGAPVAPDGILTEVAHFAEIETIGAVAVEGRQDL